MSAFWVRFSSGPRVMCVEGKDEAAARERAATVGTVKDIRTLPYPANPRMEPHETYTTACGKAEPIPAFCYKPEQCAGRTCCPQPYACTE